MSPKPKSTPLDILIKTLKMTTSTVDAEALAAARKANELLAKLGGDWGDLLYGKVTVIADPFSGPNAPQVPTNSTPRAAPPPPTRPVPPSQQPSYTGTGYAAGNSSYGGSRRPRGFYQQPKANKYAGRCQKCSQFVDAGAGRIATATDGSGQWKIECHPGQCVSRSQRKNQKLTPDQLKAMMSNPSSGTP